MCGFLKPPSPPKIPDPPTPPPPPPTPAESAAGLPDPTGVAEQRRNSRRRDSGTGRSKLRIELGNTKQPQSGLKI